MKEAKFEKVGKGLWEVSNYREVWLSAQQEAKQPRVTEEEARDGPAARHPTREPDAPAD